ncbi:TPA: type II secretion system protein GspD [Escherichia coli]|nr:type II secretion system protein GspD [Escherichia coli]
MKRWGIIFLLLVSFCRAEEKGVDLVLDSQPVSRVLPFLYQNVFHRPFILSPDLVSDPRLVSFHVTQNLPLRSFFITWLKTLNIQIQERAGVDYLSVVKPPEPPKKTFFYTPRYRSVSYLASVLQNVVDGGIFSSTVNMLDYTGSSANGDASEKTATRRLSHADNADILVYLGSEENIRRLRQIIPSVDVQADEVTVSGYVLEVQTTEHNGSGLQLIADLFKSRLHVSIGTHIDGGNVFSFQGSALNAFYNLIKDDSRFRVVSNPRLTVISGASAQFAVGEEVPVLGSVTYQDNKPVQSVTYRNSGAIFTVRPFVYGDAINLDIEQQLSNFVKTTTGVNNSPTLIKRDISTQVSVHDDEIIVLGGLATSRTSDTHSAFSWLPVLSGRTHDDDKTDIIVILQARRIKA